MNSTHDDRTTARRVMITIGLVLATVAVLAFVYATRGVLVWIVVALFFAVALNPLVNWTQRRVVRRRTVATLVVFVVAFGLIAILLALIVVPLVGELIRFADQLPQLITEARSGRGPVGRLLERTGVLRYLETHRGQIQGYVARLQQPTIGVVRGTATAVVGFITVVVLAYLMVLQAPKLVDGLVGLLNDRHAARARGIGRQCARTVTGYLTGNLLISLIAGGLTFIVLVVLGVPFAGVIALLVAIADLIPLVGATLGAVTAILAAFIHSPRAGLIVIGYFIVYQQIENHVLWPVIVSRAVQLNALTVLIAILIFAELGGVLGALLAIPVAGMIQILLREFGVRRRVRSLDEPAPPAG